MDASATDWMGTYVPLAILLIGGLLAIAIAAYYLKDKGSRRYKVVTAVGAAFGVLMALCAVAGFGEWELGTSVIVSLCSFTLIIRPFRDVHFSIIIALFAIVLVYIWLGGLTEISGVDVSFLADNPVRIVVAVVIGLLIYAVLRFGAAVVRLLGKALNWWPLLLVLGVVSVLEALLLAFGYGSIFHVLGIGQRLRNRIRFKSQ